MRTINGARSAVVALAAVCLSCVVSAQPTTRDSTGEVSARRCYRGRPEPACRTFVLTEFGVYRNLATTSGPYNGYPTDPNGYRLRDFGTHTTLEFGMMQNRGPRTAIGGSVVLGADGNGTRYGAKLRYRYWLTPDGRSADLSAGLVSATFRESSRATLFTSDVAYNFSDYGAVIARAEATRAQRRTPAALFGGVRLGSKPGLIATGVAALATLIAVVSFRSLYGNE